MTPPLTDVLDVAEGLVQQHLAAQRSDPGAICTGIVDIHHGEAWDAAAAKAGGIIALIHKASEGKDWRDPGFAANIARARAAGMSVGAYHFASASAPGAAQADFFLSVTGTSLDVLRVLDIESNPNVAAGSMDIANAAAFVARVRAVTGRWPIFYSYPARIAELMHGASPADIAMVANCKLWLAQYGDPPKHVPLPWGDWWMWQYSDYANGPSDLIRYPRDTPGFGRVDRSCFRGTTQELAAAWATAGS